jgi:hypothetical protein
VLSTAASAEPVLNRSQEIVDQGVDELHRRVVSTSVGMMSKHHLPVPFLDRGPHVVT